MSACKGCGRVFRKGKRRAVLGTDGAVTIAIVCSACASRAFSVVRPIGEAANVCASCKAMPATICSGCAAKARRELVAPVIAQLLGMAKAFRAKGIVGKDVKIHLAGSTGADERASAYEAAAHALEVEASRG